MDGCSQLLIVLVIVVLLVGLANGVWVLIKLFVHAASYPQPSGSSATSRRCRVCGSRHILYDGTCGECRTADAATANVDAGEDPESALWTSAERHLQRLHNRGLISQTKLRQILRSLEVERQQIADGVTEESQGGIVIPPTGEKQTDRPQETVSSFDRKFAPASPQSPEEAESQEAVEITDFDDPSTPDLPQLVQPAVFEDRSATVPAPPQPRRDWGRLLQAFMEEKNIRWGELLSGMLIVGSAIGLVISLWSTLKDSIPYFPALLFMLSTAAIHGAGLYTLRRWKLQSTSRGLLLISTLLVPLNFLAAIALSTSDSGIGQRPVTDPLYLTAVIVGTICYGLIAFSSSRVFRKSMWWPMWLAVMVPSVSQLVIARLANDDLTTAMLNYLAAIPLMGFLIAMVVQLQFAANGRHFSKRRADQTFQMLGIGLFSLLMAYGLLLSKTGNLPDTLAAISPIVSIVAVLMTTAGLIVHHRAVGAKLATTRTAGTAVTICGASFMIAALAFAWPRPELLVAVGLVDVIALTAMAIGARLPSLHYPAIKAAALTALTALHWSQDNINTGGNSHRLLIDALLMGRSSLLLLGMTGLGLYVSTLWKKQQRTEDARSYLFGSAALGVLSLLVAFYAGFVTGYDAAMTTPVFALAAVGFLVAGRMIREPWASWIGSGLLFTSFSHLLVFNEPVMEWLSDAELLPVAPYLLSALLTATITAGWAYVVSLKDETQSTEADGPQNQLTAGVIVPLCTAAFLASAATFPRILFIEFEADLLPHSGYLFWIAGLWGLMAVVLRQRTALAAAQVVSLFAVAFGVAAFTQTLDWFDGNFGDARHWQIQIGVLSIWCLLWTASRRIAKGNPLAAQILGVKELNVDHVVLGGLVVAAAGLCLAGVLPGLAAEFQPLEVVREVAVDRPSPPDSLAMFELVALFLGVGITAAFAMSKRVAAPTIIGGVALSMFVLVSFQSIGSNPEMQNEAVRAAWFGSTLWIVLSLVAVGVAATFWERVSTAALCGLILLGAMVPVQIASQFAAEPTTATVLRWGLAAYAVFGFAVFTQRRRLAAVMSRAGSQIGEAGAELRLETVTSTSLATTVFPLLAFTLLASSMLFGDLVLPIVDSDAWLLFREVGWSNAIPIWILAAVGLGFAFIERKPVFAIAASLFIQLGVTLYFVLPIWSSGNALNVLEFAELLQWNAIGLGVCTLLWMISPVGQAFQPDRTALTDVEVTGHPVSLERLTYRQPAEFAKSPFGVQLLLTTAVTAGLSIWAAVAIIASPDELLSLAAQLGDVKSFIAFALAATSIMMTLRHVSSGLMIDGIAISLLMFVPLLAAASGHLDVSDTWVTYHVLTAGWGIAMLCLTLFCCRPDGLQRFLPKTSDDDSAGMVTQSMNWAMAFGSVIVALGIRSQWADPQRPWWLVGTAAAAAFSAAAFGLIRRSQPIAFLSTSLVLLATTAALSHPWIGLAELPTEITYQTVLDWNLIALATAGLFWLMIEVVRQRRRNESLDPRLDVIQVHHFAGGIGMLVTALLAVVLLFVRADANAEIANRILPMASTLGWGVVMSTAVLLFASLWDRRAVHAIPAMYVMGLVASLTALDGFDLNLRHVWLSIGGIAAGFMLVTGSMYWQRGRVSQLADRLSLPEQQRTKTRTGDWLPTANLALAALAIAIHFWVVLTFEDERLRLWAGIATALLVPGFAWLADEKRGPAFRVLALSAAVVAALQIVWGVTLSDVTEAIGLIRTIRLLEVCAVATLLYAVGLLRVVKSDSNWGVSLRQTSAGTGAVSLGALLLVLGMEAMIFTSRRAVPITDAQVGVIAVILVGLAVGLIVLAVVPGRDPLRLSERGRMGYVYAAECVLSLLFLHIYLAKNDWFSGFLLPYWPYIVLGIAYVGVGFGEWFRRLKLRVLSEPLQRTGTFLPLLPAVALWTEMASRGFQEYSLVLFLVGLMYVVLAMWRQSFVYAMAAACVGNMALWSLLQSYGVVIVERPQVWLIPPALSVLAAGHLNRDRLTEAQLTSLRYICITLIYVSSTSEMFITGAGRSIWHPMILATLSICGVMAGMLMRIRAFLYLGSSFLFLSIVSMVWHAAHIIEKVWPWWVFGIVMGLVLLVFFGVFEKKRNEVLRVVGRLKEWER